jgi:phosphoglycerate dehydrogenase-like enzyme
VPSPAPGRPASGCRTTPTDLADGSVWGVTEPVVLLPSDDFVRAVREAQALNPDAADPAALVVYDGATLPSDEVLARIEFYVPPYLASPAQLGLMRRMPALRVVQSLSAGVDDLWTYLPHGVRLHNAAGVHDSSTAELALALMLASLRRLDDFVRDQGRHRWQQSYVESLADKQVLVIGYGQIGQAIDRRLAGFEVDVVRVASRARVQNGVKVHGIAELPELLPAADVVVLIVPLNATTLGLADSTFLAAMKDGALLVNMARGAVVVTAALVAELQTGRLRAALDVTDPEPLPVGDPLWESPGVIISPHTGGFSSAFLPRAQKLVSRQVTRWLAGDPLVNEVRQ